VTVPEVVCRWLPHQPNIIEVFVTLMYFNSGDFISLLGKQVAKLVTPYSTA